ncbi:aldehyde dehydrogenase family protein [Amycolatopsis sp. K13G38]|uniref:Aldehyde dehydrogenase family protein n=1 Tax=Amycolatopsis acididurans TaxID=2724524 RepID=A0ABX1JEQ0_9PSEU|nr:aldehyde dehydrogenase family protein [Amycolatopsis acididurans]NKQ57904.1 aldehyde dehydrogenase family protein [Amycolatopsis acididurans]
MSTATRPTGLFVDGEWRPPRGRILVRDKYSGEVVAELAEATAADVKDAVAGAYRACAKPLGEAERARILSAVADSLEARAADLVEDYVAETGFTIADARNEVRRAVAIYRLSAQEALRIAGEQIPLGASPGGESRLAFTIRVPVGVVVAIAPFNAPLSTVAHKVGPAIAAGNTVVLKPAEKTPLSAVNVVSAFAEAGLPPGFLQLVCAPGKVAGPALLDDDRVRFYTFTGSTAVGRAISAGAGLARTHLELGSNSVSIVADDARLGDVVNLVATAGFRKAGQVCTSVQRILVARSRFDELTSALSERVGQLRAGDPRAQDTDLGPLISEEEAVRAADWVERAARSARLRQGGVRERGLLTPALLADPAADAEVLTQEIFAPVVSIVPVRDLDDAVAKVNEGAYGLQTGVFTQDLDRAMHAARSLRVGGVMVNDTSSYHADAMPYGGVKDSGHGVEGPRYAVHDMTDPRVIVLNLRRPK